MPPAKLGRAWKQVPGFRWKLGMKVYLERDSMQGTVVELPPGLGVHCATNYEGGEVRPLGPDWEPNTASSATLGCLHELAEEILGRPVNLNTSPTGTVTAFSSPGWGTGPTRAHALLALMLGVRPPLTRP